MTDVLGQTLDHYRIERLIGRGGMGAVYEARDLNLGRTVALKVMHANLASQPRFQQRFMQEARAAARLTHPNIVRVYDSGYFDDQLFLVMEMVDGGSLREHLGDLEREKQRLELPLAVSVTRQISTALQYAHERDMIHRDVKPDNVLLTTSRQGDGTLEALLTDFGLAKLMKANITSLSDQPMGTYAYMSPEQCMMETVDARTDVYGLGTMLFELVIGHPPYQPQSIGEAIRMHTNDPIPDPRLLRPDLPADIAGVIVRSLAKSPADRLSSAGEMGSVLQQALTALGGAPVTRLPSAAPIDHRPTYVMSQPPPDLPELNPQAEPPAVGEGDHIVITDERGQSRVAPLTQNLLEIGRVPGNDIELNHVKVSRTHARIEREADGSYQITDLGSSNGTWLGNKRLTPHQPEVWPSGQLARIGGFSLRLHRASSSPPGERTRQAAVPPPILPAAGPPAAQPAAPLPASYHPATRVEHFSNVPDMPMPPMPQFSQLSVSPGQAGMDRLLIVGRGEPTRAVALDQAQITIGRTEEGNDVVLGGERVSRAHAVLERDSEGHYFVTDLDSSNGTWVGDRPLTPHVRESIQYGETVRIGDYWLKLEQAAALPAVAPGVAGMPMFSGTPSMVSGAAPISVTINPGTVSVRPGIRASTTINITNRAPVQGVYLVQVTGLPEGWAAVPHDPVPVGPQQIASVGVSFDPPRNCSTSAGDHRFQAQVVSLDPAGGAKAASGTVRIETFHDLNIELSPTQLTGESGSVLKVHNNGNAPDDYDITLRDVDQAVQYDFAPNHLHLQPGQRVEVPIYIAPLRRPIVGSRRIYPFNIEVASQASDVQQTQHGTLTVKPVIPLWSALTGAVATLGLIALLLLLLAGRPSGVDLAGVQTQQAVASQTASVLSQAEILATNVAATNTALAVASTDAAQTAVVVGDDDLDGLPNAREAELGTNPGNPDTDGDGLSDGQEVNSLGTNPLLRDSDNDTLSDQQEVTGGTNPNDPDTDGDGRRDNVDPAPGQLPTSTPPSTAQPGQTAPPTDSSGTSVALTLTGQAQSVQNAQTSAAQTVTAQVQAQNTTQAQTGATFTAVALTQQAAPGFQVTSPTGPIKMQGTEGADFTTQVSVQVANPGTAPLSLFAPTVSSANNKIVLDSHTLPGTIAPNGGTGTVSLTLRCVAADDGVFTGTLSLPHNAAGSPATIQLECTVNAPPPPPPPQAAAYSSNPAPSAQVPLTYDAAQTRYEGRLEICNGTSCADATDRQPLNITVNSANPLQNAQAGLTFGGIIDTEQVNSLPCEPIPATVSVGDSFALCFYVQCAAGGETAQLVVGYTDGGAQTALYNLTCPTPP